MHSLVLAAAIAGDESKWTSEYWTSALNTTMRFGTVHAVIARHSVWCELSPQRPLEAHFTAASCDTGAEWKGAVLLIVDEYDW